MEGTPGKQRGDTDTAVAILLAVAAVLAALIGARAAIVGDSGSDTWHTSVRQDVKRDAGLVEDARRIYAEEATAGLRVAEAKIRAEELRKAARKESGLVSDYLRAEARTQDQLVKTLTPTGDLTSSLKYDRKDGSYDVLARLADRRNERPDLVRLDPDATEERGSTRSKESALLVACTILVAIAFLLGALAEGFEQWRRRLVPVGYAFAAIGLVCALVVEFTL